MKYSPRYFSNNMPKWKKTKDTLYCRFFMRPLSFFIASIHANLGISANATSYFNVVIALSAGILLLFPNFICSLTGAILISVWLLFDCVDGNLARNYKKQAYGEYADALSSYLLVPMVCFGVAMQLFYNGCFAFESGNHYIIIIGFFTGLSDTMMRLIYHKYKEVTMHMIKLGMVNGLSDSRNDHSKVNSLKVRIESDGGIAGIVPIIVLLSCVFSHWEIAMIYLFIYYFGSFILLSLFYTKKAISHRRKTFIDPEDKDND